MLRSRTSEQGQSIKHSSDQAAFDHRQGSPTSMRTRHSQDQQDRARPINWMIDFADPQPPAGRQPPPHPGGGPGPILPGVTDESAGQRRLWITFSGECGRMGLSCGQGGQA
jgi:hypothetical protein